MTPKVSPVTVSRVAPLAAPFAGQRLEITAASNVKLARLVPTIAAIVTALMTGL